MKKKKLILIKLGGSIITNKEMPMEIRKDTLRRLAREIVKAQEQLPDYQIVVGHGSGSFGHVPASKYKTMSGFVTDDSRLGMAIVQDSAAQLNRHVVHTFLTMGQPAVSLLPSNMVITRKRKAEDSFIDVLGEYLEQGLMPVTQGDVIVDRGQGCTIWSTEEVLAFFAEKLIEKNWKIDRIVHVTEVKGVLDHDGNVVPEITEENQAEVRKMIGVTKGFDVTGGMWHKIEESLQLAKHGVKSVILAGTEKDNLLNCLTNKNCIGTSIG